MYTGTGSKEPTKYRLFGIIEFLFNDPLDFDYTKYVIYYFTVHIRALNILYILMGVALC